MLWILQELQYIEEEHHRTKITLQGRVKDREDEIQKLRNQVRKQPHTWVCTYSKFSEDL